MHRRYSSLLISISFAAMLLLTAIVPLGYGTIISVNAQQEPSTHNDNNNNMVQMPVATSGPSVNDPHLKVEQFVNGLKSPTTMAFLDQHRILVLEKDSGTVRMIVDGKLQPEP